MASESGNFRESHFATIAAADTALDSFFTAVDTRLDAYTTQATRANGTINLIVTAEDAGGTPYDFKISVRFDTGTVAAGTALTHCQSIVTALDTFADAVEAASAFTTVIEVEADASVTMSA